MMNGKISDIELEIMKVLWASDRPLSEKEIRAVIEKKFAWKKQTTQTLIRRLVEKGAILREKRDVYYHSPAVSRDEVEKTWTVDLLNKVFGGNAKNLVSAMLNHDILSSEDIDDLKDYWQERKQINE